MKSVESTAKSELQNFAAWFHQDFGVTFVDANDGALKYLASLSMSQRAALRDELAGLMSEYPGKDQKGLRNAWRRLGAEWVPRREDLRTLMIGWISALNMATSPPNNPLQRTPASGRR